MDLDYPAEAEAFRAEIKDWLKANLPDGWFDDGFEMSESERAGFTESWTNKLFEGGWICASWPAEYGGKGLTTMQSVVLNEEFAESGAPMRGDFFGDTLVGPTILQWGTEEQKREFLPGILKGQIGWCQGFSEPEAGSDLAALKTKAELDGDEWVINGQKVWTTRAQHADYCFVLARTDPNVSKHAGISYLLVPMDQPGVDIRPIEQVDGSREFNEVFFSDARCPKDNVVGGVNNGWKVAMTTLGFERGTSATTGHRRFQVELDEIIDVARANGAIADPRIRQRLAHAQTKVNLMKIGGLRSLTATVQKKKDKGVAALGAMNKMNWSEYHRNVMELWMDVSGVQSLILDGDFDPDSPNPRRRNGKDSYQVNQMQASFFFSRSETIWGGTAEIQRNIVGERVLGLPKEPRP